eukprot:gnl/MRDRNA2_/MRDRNA2_144983_c0_seq1.p1 gnl/MRDRNA2_/MRDRNA2_144983_c0~~gnl/MRDRNA2_/MRDRNA2_144983_c0_seq1.p1  ORF type:complete len:514 (+),score=126.75 gnl/MRDRNA2_/MRDRNA2_144983_c0_seq1:130-1542(+)
MPATASKPPAHIQHRGSSAMPANGSKPPVGSFWSGLGNDVSAEAGMFDLSQSTGLVQSDQTSLLVASAPELASQELCMVDKARRICCYHCYKQFNELFKVQRDHTLTPGSSKNFCSEQCAVDWEFNRNVTAKRVKEKETLLSAVRAKVEERAQMIAEESKKPDDIKEQKEARDAENRKTDAPPDEKREKLCCYHCYKQFFEGFKVQLADSITAGKPKHFCSQHCAETWKEATASKAKELERRRAQLEERAHIIAEERRKREAQTERREVFEAENDKSDAQGEEEEYKLGCHQCCKQFDRKLKVHRADLAIPGRPKSVHFCSELCAAIWEEATDNEGKELQDANLPDEKLDMAAPVVHEKLEGAKSDDQVSLGESSRIETQAQGKGRKLCCYHCYKQFYDSLKVQRADTGVRGGLKHLDFCSEECAHVWEEAAAKKAIQLQQRHAEAAKLQAKAFILAEESKRDEDGKSGS